LHGHQEGRLQQIVGFGATAAEVVANPPQLGCASIEHRGEVARVSVFAISREQGFEGRLHAPSLRERPALLQEVPGNRREGKHFANGTCAPGSLL
jgi:hypothetical protein